MYVEVLYVYFFSDGPGSVAIQPTKPVGVKGQATVLSCSADGHPTPSYEWQLPQGLSLVAQSLTLSNIQFGYGGIYTCVAKNAINTGEMTSNESVELQVEGKMLL